MVSRAASITATPLAGVTFILPDPFAAAVHRQHNATTEMFSAPWISSTDSVDNSVCKGTGKWPRTASKLACRCIAECLGTLYSIDNKRFPGTLCDQTITRFRDDRAFPTLWHLVDEFQRGLTNASSASAVSIPISSIARPTRAAPDIGPPAALSIRDEVAGMSQRIANSPIVIPREVRHSVRSTTANAARRPMRSFGRSSPASSGSRSRRGTLPPDRCRARAAQTQIERRIG